MKKILFAALFLVLSAGVNAQILDPVKWSYAAKRTSKTEAVVFIKANIDRGWHLYSQTVGEGGPVPTSFSFNPSKEYTLVGKTSEPKPLSKYDKTFSMNVAYFESSVIFQQKVKLKASKTVVKGKLEYMACNDQKCLPPDEVSFSIPVK